MSAYQSLYNLIQSLPKSNGDINPNVANIIKQHKSNNIGTVMAFPPKVGGTFLRSALITLLGKENYIAALKRGSYASTDQARDLYFPSILHHFVEQGTKPSAMVAHCHMYATRPVTAILELFNIPVIVNTRNIFDTLLSFYEMLHNDPKSITDDFILRTHSPFSEMSKEEQRYNLVNVAPIWYARFYSYWIRYTDECIEAERESPLWTSFNELKHEPAKLLLNIVRKVDPHNTYRLEECTAAMDQMMTIKAQLRFNKGQSGRGKDFFTEEEQQTITNLMARDDEQKKRLVEYGVL